jgi:hypothetical protein
MPLEKVGFFMVNIFDVFSKMSFLGQKSNIKENFIYIKF